MDTRVKKSRTSLYALTDFVVWLTTGACKWDVQAVGLLLCQNRLRPAH